MGYKFQSRGHEGEGASFNLLGISRSRMSLILVTALLYQRGIHGKAFNSIFGPYTAYTERFYNGEHDNLSCRWYLRATHFNPLKPREVQLLTGNVTIDEVIDDRCGIKGVLDVRSNNQWKENAFVFYYKSNACQKVKENIPGFYNLFFKKSEIKGTCALKPGVYEVNNAPAEWSFPNVPTMPYGQYRFRVLANKFDRLISNLVVDCRVVPKH
ncbi:uncharacterized protein LOC127751777 [Frankliniella occidentalis]|uniref:Uncharacterized protein LOC127751777 n=1 Tax=Frankliniella occidentalis TaxID=133901 RepID=A0A9C6X9L6_FRAOC|nr:uncharacterized protein LOC127751777 [Frankliniella occidentalis]XP_052131798.1 uncharacterized protein LOC127751777 [Frankliniella occidentalis]